MLRNGSRIMHRGRTWDWDTRPLSARADRGSADTGSRPATRVDDAVIAVCFLALVGLVVFGVCSCSSSGSPRAAAERAGRRAWDGQLRGARPDRDDPAAWVEVPRVDEPTADALSDEERPTNNRYLRFHSSRGCAWPRALREASRGTGPQRERRRGSHDGADGAAEYRRTDETRQMLFSDPRLASAGRYVSYASSAVRGSDSSPTRTFAATPPAWPSTERRLGYNRRRALMCRALRRLYMERAVRAGLADQDSAPAHCSRLPSCDAWEACGPSPSRSSSGGARRSDTRLAALARSGQGRAARCALRHFGRLKPPGTPTL